MEQNSIAEGTSEQHTTAPATTSEAAPATESQQAPEVAAAPTRRRAPRRVTAASVDAEAPAEAAAEPAASPADAADGDAPAPKKRVSRARKKADTVEGETESGSEALAEAAAPAEAALPEEAPKKTTAARRRRASSETPAEDAKSVAADAQKTDAATSDAPSKEAVDGNVEDVEKTAGDAAETAPTRKRNTRSRSRKATADAGDAAADQSESKQNDSDAAEKAAENDDQSEKSETSGNGRNNGGNDGQTRSSRTRQRERKRRGGSDEDPEITEDDVLLPIAGILDVLDNYAFVRTSGYLPGTGDVYVSLGQVKKYGLRKGDAVVGAIRQPRDSDGGGRQKYNAIVKVDSINSNPVEENQTRPEFADFTPIHPNERIRLETEAAQLGARVVDLFAPVGKGQRGLIVGPHESGKSTALRQIAQAVAQNQPDAHLMLVVIDERPEDVTELQRTVNGEVIASTFDRPAEDHATVVELAIERAKRLVELGHDVVVLIDSLTSLARAYNLAAPPAVRLPAGSLDAAAVFPVKRVLSAARNIENGGSLTVIATVSAQPESKFDDALLGELEGTANMQLRLSGDAADRRVFPAIDFNRSSTRNEALLTSDAEARIMNRIRRSYQSEVSINDLEQLLGRLEGTSSNVEFLAVTQRQLDA